MFEKVNPLNLGGWLSLSTFLLPSPLFSFSWVLFYITKTVHCGTYSTHAPRNELVDISNGELAKEKSNYQFHKN